MKQVKQLSVFWFSVVYSQNGYLLIQNSISGYIIWEQVCQMLVTEKNKNLF